MNPDKIRSVLNLLFLVLAVASVITYYAVDNFKVFIYLCSTAIFCKVMEFFIRFTNR